jgi:HD-GYP domain-containing protein (c-di-GMP phosphodiesterase class II)
MSQFAALDELKRGAGSQFDPKLVDIFLKIASQTQEGL